MTSLNTDLRYIDAGHVDTSEGKLGRATLVDRTKTPLGRLDGIVFDPMSRQVRYYVVESQGWLTTRHYLLPLMAARLDRDRHAVEIDLDADDLKQLDEVEPDELPRYSDEDLLASMFHSRP
jgi:hypothetical protein